jgi:hypothetical protein
MPLPRRSPQDQVTATFLRGLTIGALVGAVIAGSSMLTRRRATRTAVAVPARDGTPTVDTADGRGSDAVVGPGADAAGNGALDTTERGGATGGADPERDGGSSTRTR